MQSWPAGRLHAGDKLLRNIAFCVHQQQQQQQQFRRNTAMAPTGRTAGKQAGRSRPATDRAAGWSTPNDDITCPLVNRPPR
ncbi:unnamed protein product [Haemonchus placei]|uniref:Uncharacterized protein n=1 Tax=Haemonchus placei TaxID=6290 RepID=A0A0N4X1E4_HAEPC|nr:unnamed protein product [Haemonchus placei]